MKEVPGGALPAELSLGGDPRGSPGAGLEPPLCALSFFYYYYWFAFFSFFYFALFSLSPPFLFIFFIALFSFFFFFCHPFLPFFCPFIPFLLPISPFFFLLFSFHPHFPHFSYIYIFPPSFNNASLFPPLLKPRAAPGVSAPPPDGRRLGKAKPLFYYHFPTLTLPSDYRYFSGGCLCASPPPPPLPPLPLILII